MLLAAPDGKTWQEQHVVEGTAVAGDSPHDGITVGNNQMKVLRA
jgi:hypothetical protein